MNIVSYHRDFSPQSRLQGIGFPEFVPSLPSKLCFMYEQQHRTLLEVPLYLYDGNGINYGSNTVDPALDRYRYLDDDIKLAGIQHSMSAPDAHDLKGSRLWTNT